MKHKAIFLDRDGTIIVDKCYLSDPTKIEYIQGTRKALKIFQELGYKLFIVTNQSGIGRGYYKVEDMNAVHDQMQQDIISFGLKKYDDIVACPHTPDEKCDCRKPAPKLILDLISLYHINPQNSFMVGDKISDVEAGENAGIKGILLTERSNQIDSFKNLLEFSNSLS